MFGPDARPASSSDSQAALNLVGWVPLAHVSLWATNMALELNTHQDSIRFRLANDSPARILNERPTSSTHRTFTWIEPLEKFYTPDAAPKTKVVQADPKGLAPEYPRLVVFERAGGYTRVATGVSTTGQLTHAEIARARAQRDNMRQIARGVDIVFLVDQSGSMHDEIDEVKRMLTQIATQLRAIALEDLAADDPLLKLELTVSVLGFGGDVTVHLPRTSLLKTRSVHGAFNRMRAGSATRDERLHPALVTALNGNFLGAETMRRFILLLTDEPGVTPASDQRLVLNAMPDFSNHFHKAAENVGWKIQHMTEKEEKNYIGRRYSPYLRPVAPRYWDRKVETVAALRRPSATPSSFPK